MKSRGILKYANRALRRRILAGAEPEWLTKHIRADYIRNAVLASPEWLDRTVIKLLCCEADRLETLTGIPHVCDHIVPLTHPHVCGLNVPWNVQILPHAVNAAKSNNYHPDQLALL